MAKAADIGITGQNEGERQLIAGGPALLNHVSTGHDLASTDRLLKAAGMKLMGGGYVG